jgi:2-phospho-L-lactate guanylyltransferase
MIHAVVPVKSLAAGKSRLRERHPAAAVDRLAAALLEDVLAGLLGVPELARVVVASPDAQVAEIARRAGAEALTRDDAGLNPAVDAATAALCAPADDALVVLGDVAGLRSAEVSELLAACPRPGVALAPSRDGGTSALIRRPHTVIAAGFGPASAARHRALAAAAGVPCAELALPSLAIDVDEPRDLEALLASSGPAPHTRRVLRELAAAGRAPAP